MAESQTYCLENNHAHTHTHIHNLTHTLLVPKRQTKFSVTEKPAVFHKIQWRRKNKKTKCTEEDGTKLFWHTQSTRTYLTDKSKEKHAHTHTHTK